MAVTDMRTLIPTDLGPDDPLIVVPYVPGMLRDQTAAAVIGSGLRYLLWELDPADPYAYASALVAWWQVDADLVVIEQDVVPADGMIRALAECPEAWCTQAYHVGEGRFTTGLGFCKIAARVKAEWPYAAALAMRDKDGREEHIDWHGVNEALERKLLRHHYWAHEHPGRAEHLHYPGDGRESA